MPELRKCDFEGNTAHLGGAVAVNGASATVEEPTFRRNAADDGGGAFYLALGGHVLVDGGAFEKNVAASWKIGLVGAGCTAVMRCTGADRSLVGGGGVVSWEDEGCGFVGAETESWGKLKIRYR